MKHLMSLPLGLFGPAQLVAIVKDMSEHGQQSDDCDVADIIAGALQTSRGHAYTLMQEALDERDNDRRS